MNKDIVEKQSFKDDRVGDIQYVVILEVEQYSIKDSAQTCNDVARLLVKDNARRQHGEDQGKGKPAFNSAGYINQDDFGYDVQGQLDIGEREKAFYPGNEEGIYDCQQIE